MTKTPLFWRQKVKYIGDTVSGVESPLAEGNVKYSEGEGGKEGHYETHFLNRASPLFCIFRSLTSCKQVQFEMEPPIINWGHVN